MGSESLIKAVEQQEALDRLSDQIQPFIRDTFESAGPAGKEVKNFLHGTWLGHPLHPALTDVPLGAWTAAFALDAMESISGRRELGAGADVAIAVGLVGAAGAAVTGLTDWSETDGRARKVGLFVNRRVTAFDAGREHELTHEAESSGRLGNRPASVLRC